VWKHVKIEPHASAKDAGARRATFKRRLARSDMRKLTECTIRLRGGPEAWVEVRARGRVWRVTGDTAIYDLLRRIHGT
jgi:hypothetical protein